jgi:hypothetical protein
MTIDLICFGISAQHFWFYAPQRRSCKSAVPFFVGDVG